MSAAQPNAAVQTNDEDTDDDYFAFADSADTEASQAASDTTNNNKCDLDMNYCSLIRANVLGSERNQTHATAQLRSSICFTRLRGLQLMSNVVLDVCVS